MLVGMITDEKIKKISLENNISFTDVLEGFGIEDLLRRIYESDYKDYLWLINSNEIGLDSYAKTRDARLEFYYIESHKYIPEGIVEPGGPCNEAQLNYMWETILAPDKRFKINPHPPITWTKELTKPNFWELRGEYKDMQIFVSMHILKMQQKQLYPQKKVLPLFMEENRPLTIYAYGQEYALAEKIYEIMDKLELISNMKIYDEIYEILSTESVSGRRMMEHMIFLTNKNPQILNEIRLEQLESYKEYPYMLKRWKQYEKRKNSSEKPKQQPRDWQEIIQKVTAFTGPLWKALCTNSVFIDDWMAELSRFMG